MGDKNLRKLTSELLQDCIRLYRDGLSLQQIADVAGVTRQAMWDVLRKRIPMRSRLRYGPDNHFYRGGIRADDHAQNILEKAIERREIQRRDACEVCGASGQFADGRTKIQAHHDDYTKPLEARWLCQPCHHEWHKQNTAIGTLPCEN